MFGIYSQPRRNQPVDVEAVNPKEDSRKTAESGNAGLDGYTVLSRADRESGLRPMIGGEPARQGYRFNEE